MLSPDSHTLIGSRMRRIRTSTNDRQPSGAASAGRKDALRGRASSVRLMMTPRQYRTGPIRQATGLSNRTRLLPPASALPGIAFPSNFAHPPHACRSCHHPPKTVLPLRSRWRPPDPSADSSPPRPSLTRQAVDLAGVVGREYWQRTSHRLPRAGLPSTGNEGKALRDNDLRNTPARSPSDRAWFGTTIAAVGNLRELGCSRQVAN